MGQRYQSYSNYLQNKYGEKVYKLPVNLPVSCPNRDGTMGRQGCIFCAEAGAGFEALSNELSVREQLKRNMDYIGSRYHAGKFIAYFQNFTNTYLPIHMFEKALEEACIENIVGLDISTRPDCIRDDYLNALEKVHRERGMDIYLELGLQTVNYHSLKRIQRGHGLAEFIDGVRQCKRYGFNTCTHLILNLPWDDMDDVIENAKVLSALKVDQVKLHALYIMDNTVMGDMYKNGEFQVISLEEYKERVVTFLEYLDPQIIVQRLIGRAPEENSLFVNWNTSWWKIRDDIEELMEIRDTWQGKKFNYLGGSALKGFNYCRE